MKRANFNCPNCRCPLEASVDDKGIHVKIDHRVTAAIREMAENMNRLFRKVFDPKLWGR